jgi:hypothetical protein
MSDTLGSISRGLRVLNRRMKRAATLAAKPRKVAGRPRDASYADALMRLAQKRAHEALHVNIAELMKHVHAATSLEDAQRRVLAAYKGKRLDSKALADVVEKANIMAHLSGRLTALEEV